MKKFNYSFVVGRFQPLHLGHQQLIREALDRANNIIVFLGSSQESGTKKNPLTVDERKLLFYNAFKEDIHRFTFVPLSDQIDNTTWTNSITEELKKIVKNTSVCNVFFNKDRDTTISNDLLFELYNSTPIPITQSDYTINATDIRQIIFEDEVCPRQLIDTHLSSEVAQILYARKFIPLSINFQEVSK